ncbi:5' exonuclease Apollo-like [Acanthaster planci]|uniref:5' exonuclease Apollo n=1 Tax=Acanthaster planci TaxID=133434 RepID=A0A8B7ZIM3_ACAPL|nr:5' exonuclease Apollo-like [Acanthaster planci]
MNGHIIPDTPIVVDLWRRADTPSSKLYFLSHMHSDHTQGLSASWRWPIHCSPLSAKLLIDKFQISECLIRPLELNQSHILPLDYVGRESMTVTLFDANHCPGSVMFLFEGYFGRVLYTGDFRYDLTTFPESCLGPGQPVDKLYLDNTFNHPRYRFPSRAECTEKILEILARHPEHEVVLGVYTLGKEELLVDIALALKTRVVVSPARLRALQVLELLDVFTTDKDCGHVRLVPRRAISKKNMAKWNREAPTIAIIPTGLFSSLDGQPFISQEDVFIVPYSDHSSYLELRQFVARVCPRVIIPIVKDSCFMSSDRCVTDMHNFDDLLDRSPSAPITIPPSVLQFMSTDLSRSVHHSESQKNFQMIVEMRKTQKLMRNNHTALGVVFEDDDNQEQPQAGSESSHTNGQNTNSFQLTKRTNPTRELTETKAPLTEVPCEMETMQSEPSPQQFSENQGSHMCEGLASRKKDFLPGKSKRKFDGSRASGRSKSPSADFALIRSMSSKKPRTLPESFVITPKVVVNAFPGGERRRLASPNSSTKEIQDYFKLLNTAAPQSCTKQMNLKPDACNTCARVASPQAVPPVSDTKPAGGFITASRAHQPEDKAVNVTDSSFSVGAPNQRIVDQRDKRNSETDEVYRAAEMLQIARTGSVEDKGGSLPPKSSRSTDPSRCSDHIPFGYICVKPLNQLSRSQKGDSLRKAFQDVFSNQH